ncbi:MAG TPA: hypothetical protein PKU97_07955 [Kofleriaceae bacterium]|nr:hypothetical protein [Kofleriaceae bacterium]
MRRSSIWVFTVLALASVAGCADAPVSRAVGARCDTDRECDERCYTGGDFPGGFCSIGCRSDTDCPQDARCARQLAGGICLLSCADNAACEFLGPAWECQALSGASGKVCLGD